MNRRQLIKLSLGGAAVVAAAGGVLRVFSGGYRSLLMAGEVPIALSVKEWVVLKAAVAAMLPAEDGFPAGLSLGVPQKIDEEVWAADPGIRDDFKNGLQVLEHATLGFGHFQRFSALEGAARREYLERMMNSDNGVLRQVAFAVKELVHLVYYAQPEVWAVMGYDGPFVKQAVPPASHLAYAEVLRGRR